MREEAQLPTPTTATLILPNLCPLLFWCSAHFYYGRAIFELFTINEYYGQPTGELGGLLDEPIRKVPELSCHLNHVELDVDLDRIRYLFKCLDGDVGV